MPFTTVALANQMNDPDLAAWAASTPANQGPDLPNFTAYFNNVQAWITNNGGANPFGWNNLGGLTHVNGNPVALPGPADRAPFNDAFNDTQAHIGTPGFHLFQAATAAQRLIRVLIRLN